MSPRTGGLLTDDQQLLSASMRAVLTKKASSAAVRAAMDSERGFDGNLWSVLCEQVGAGGIAIPDAFGGSGGTLSDALVVTEELGRVLAPTPALGSSGICAALLEVVDDADATRRLLPAIASGRSIVSLCVADDRGRWRGEPPIRATDRGGWTVSGTSRFVLDGRGAETFLVVAAAPQGRALFEVDARSPRVRVEGGSTMDPTRALYDVVFDAADAALLGTADVESALEHALDTGVILLAGEQVGAAARCLELTVEYTMSRYQFGRPIGSFQAVKHRLADLLVLVRSARATAYSAARSPTRHVDAAVAKIHCSEALSAVAAECIQLHGGIAITWDHDAHLYFKRAHSSSHLFGPPSTYVDALADAVGLGRVRDQPPRSLTPSPGSE